MDTTFDITEIQTSYIIRAPKTMIIVTIYMYTNISTWYVENITLSSNHAFKI